MCVDLAYLGGLFDGEGCFCISKRSERLYQLMASVKIRERHIVESFQAAFGGSIHTRKDNKKHATVHMWYITDSETLVRFVDTVLPYLSCKAKQAIVMRGMCFQRLLFNRKALSADDLGIYEAHYQEMRVLNKNGVNKA